MIFVGNLRRFKCFSSPSNNFSPQGKPRISRRVAVGNPLERSLRIILPNRRAFQIVAVILFRRAVFLAEETFRRREPRARINNVAVLLFGEFDARNVDNAKPVELFAIGAAAANVNHQRVIEQLIHFVGRQILIINLVDGKSAVNVLAEAPRSLLTVKQLIRAVDDLVVHRFFRPPPQEFMRAEL